MTKRPARKCFATAGDLDNHGTAVNRSMQTFAVELAKDNVWVGYWDSENIGFENGISWSEIQEKCRRNIVSSDKPRFPRLVKNTAGGNTDKPVHCAGCCQGGCKCEALKIEYHPITATRENAPVLKCLMIFRFWSQGVRMVALISHKGGGMYLFQKTDGSMAESFGLIRPTTRHVTRTSTLKADRESEDEIDDEEEDEEDDDDDDNGNLRDDSYHAPGSRPVRRAAARSKSSMQASNINIDEDERDAPIPISPTSRSASTILTASTSRTAPPADAIARLLQAAAEQVAAANYDPGARNTARARDFEYPAREARKRRADDDDDLGHGLQRQHRGQIRPLLPPAPTYHEYSSRSPKIKTEGQHGYNDDDDEVIEVMRPRDMERRDHRDRAPPNLTPRRGSLPSIHDDYARVLGEILERSSTANQSSECRHIMYVDMRDAVRRGDRPTLFYLAGRVMSHIALE